MGCALVLVAACGAARPSQPENVAPATAPSSDDGPPCEGDKFPHPGLSAVQYAKRIESPDRSSWQQPKRVIEEIGIVPGMRVAEIGTGSGFWLPYLDEAVAPGGTVVGEDIDPELLRLARRRVRDEGLSHVELRRGRHDDPGLEPRRYDRILMVNTYHHVCDKRALLAGLRRALRSAGRLVVIDFRAGQRIPVACETHRVAREAVIRSMRRAGFVLAEEHGFLPYQYLLQFRRAQSISEVTARRWVSGRPRRGSVACPTRRTLALHRDMRLSSCPSPYTFRGHRRA